MQTALEYYRSLTAACEEIAMEAVQCGDDWTAQHFFRASEVASDMAKLLECPQSGLQLMEVVG